MLLNAYKAQKIILSVPHRSFISNITGVAEQPSTTFTVDAGEALMDILTLQNDLQFKVSQVWYNGVRTAAMKVAGPFGKCAAFLTKRYLIRCINTYGDHFRLCKDLFENIS